MIANYKKSNRVPVLAGLLCLGLGFLTLTDAQPGDKSPTPSSDLHSAPVILASSPATGSTDVDPSLNEITVTFNRDMGGGMSWTGGGPDYPTIPKDAKIQWRDKRTCVLPVKLEPAHFYRVGINSSSYRNFRSAAGIPAVPTAIYFTTQGASEELKAKTRVPHLLTVNPKNGARNVSSTITEIRATFDVAMGGGMSWCTVSDDDQSFPKAPEGKTPHWTEDKKTCILPVQLKPGTTYRLKFNDVNYRNFQSEAGIPLEPVTYTFKTGDK